MSTLNTVGAMLWGSDHANQPRMAWRDHFITILMGTWLMIGLFVDGWAHNNLASTLESFFTPWHALFYSGFTATALWMVWLVVRNLRAGLRGAAAVPQGYGLGLVGLVIFGLGGMGDMIWHVVFGIEKDIQALLSPTHLVLFLGGMLILASPARAAWASTDRELDSPTFKAFLPTLISVTLSASFIVFINQYLWGFNKTFAFQGWAAFVAMNPGETGHVLRELGESVGLATILITTIFVMAPLLLMMRRWRLPLGSATLYFTVMSVLMSGMVGFSRPHMRIFVPVLCGILADLLVAGLNPSPKRLPALRTFAFVIPLIMWSLYMLMGHISIGMTWSPELWVGIALMASFGSLGLSLLVAPAPVPQ